MEEPSSSSERLRGSDLHCDSVDSNMNHRLETQLRCSFIPTGSDIARITRYANEKAEEIRRINIEIDQLRKALSKLAGTRERLQECHDQAMGLFAPIRKLPVEILKEIFSPFAEHEFEFWWRKPPGYRDFPPLMDVLHISQVCYRWRNVSQSMPRLWTGNGLFINLDVEKQGYTNLLSHCLSMSQSLPLVLRVHSEKRERMQWDFRRPVNTYYPCTPMFRELLLRSDRWYSARFELTEATWKMMVGELRKRPITGYFPRLQDLSMDVPPSDPLCTEMFSDVPRLSFLMVDHEIPNPATFPYSQLKSVELDREYIHVLPKCHNLEKLIMKSNGSKYPRSSRDLILKTLLPTYPALSTLDFHCRYLDEVSPVLCNFTSPSLAMLSLRLIPELHDNYRLLRFPSEDFASMISRSGCSLQALRLDGLFLATREELYQVLQMVPTLIDLNLGVGDTSLEYNKGDHDWSFMIGAGLFDLLTIQPEMQYKEDVLLPCLSSLTVQSRIVGDEFVERFVDMARSRQSPSIPGVTCLGNLQYTFWTKSPYCDLESNEWGSICTRIQARHI